jgi:hypothetical protein
MKGAPGAPTPVDLRERSGGEQSYGEPNRAAAVGVSPLTGVTFETLWHPQESDVRLSSGFNLQEAILQAMARQARRSMRSLSESSCSSLSSLSTSVSICSATSITYLPPLIDGCAGDLEREGGLENHAGPSFQVQSLEITASCTLGKRRREGDPEKERARRSKRQRKNPRKRGRSKFERVAKSKRSQAAGTVVQSEKPFTLVRSLKVEQKLEVFDIEAVKAKKVTVVSWDGM